MTVNSISTDRPSAMKPNSKVTSPHWNQVHRVTMGDALASSSVALVPSDVVASPAVPSVVEPSAVDVSPPATALSAAASAGPR